MKMQKSHQAKNGKKNQKGKKNSYSFLNFNTGDIASTKVGRTRVAPSASGRTTVTTRPKFTSLKESTVIRHSEYVGDITQSQTFVAVDYPVNPGLARTFAWLSSVAQSYERYRFKQLNFRYEVLSSTNTTGKVFFVPNFNVQDAPPETKLEALAYEYAVGSQPWIQFSVEVPKKYLATYNEFFVRGADLGVNQDLKTFDTLTLYVCSEGASVEGLVVGEFWIDYEIELMNPVGQQDNLSYLSLFNNSQFWATYAGGFGNVCQYPFGQTPTFAGGLPISISTGTVGQQRLTFLTPWQGILTLVYVFGPGATSATFAWPPRIDQVTFNSQNGLAPTFSYSTLSTVSSGVQSTATMQLSALGGQYIELSFCTSGGSETTLLYFSSTLSPFWLSELPPGGRAINPLTEFRKARKKAAQLEDSVLFPLQNHVQVKKIEKY